MRMSEHDPQWTSKCHIIEKSEKKASKKKKAKKKKKID